MTLFCAQVLVNGPQTPLATSLKPAEVVPHVPEIPLGMYSCHGRVGESFTTIEYDFAGLTSILDQETIEMDVGCGNSFYQENEIEFNI